MKAPSSSSFDPAPAGPEAPHRTVPRLRGLHLRCRHAVITFAVVTSLNNGPLEADSLWKDDVARPLVSDQRAVAIGDILTIIVQENTTTAKDNATKTGRQSSAQANFNSFLYPPSSGAGLIGKDGELLKFSGKSEFNGGGSINNSERIFSRIAVRVVDVLPNKNLVIEGSRDTSFASEKQTAILRGTVRPEDIAANNTVMSFNIADATIKFVGKGTLSDSQRKGWFQRVWEKVAPF